MLNEAPKKAFIMIRKHKISIALAVMVVLGLFTSLYAQTGKTSFPQPKYISLKSEFVTLTKEIDIRCDTLFYNKYKATFESFKHTASLNKNQDNIYVQIVFAKVYDFSNLNSEQQTSLTKAGSYLLDIENNEIEIFANEDEGYLNALSTLEALIDVNKGVIQEQLIIDYPDIKTRVLHISMRSSLNKEYFKSIIHLARLQHFNTLIWLNFRGIDLESLSHLEGKDKWSKEEFKEMIAFVKQNGMEIIPELKLLSGQKKFLGTAYPQYMYNKVSYDPRIKEVYSKHVFPAIDELLLLTGATKFHIGHDEVVGWKQKHYSKGILNKNDKQLPPNLFLEDVITVHDYLESKNIETWMWSDMLYTKEEFPNMAKAGANLNGLHGYAALKSKLPKNIVLNLWHYRGGQTSFPTADAMIDYGHRVLGATWQFEETVENYTKYMYDLNNENVLGMIATTWFGLSEIKKDEIEEIIKFSGNAFWNAK